MFFNVFREGLFCLQVILLLEYFKNVRMTKMLPPMFKTRQQIADEYGISRKTLYRKLKRYGVLLPTQGLLTPEQQQTIYALLGDPSPGHFS